MAKTKNNMIHSLNVERSASEKWKEPNGWIFEMTVKRGYPTPK